MNLKYLKEVVCDGKKLEGYSLEFLPQILSDDLSFYS
jgi:hypothetical protein